MGRLFVPTERSIDGPWLLGVEELEDLDVLIKRIAEKLQEAQDKWNEKKQSDKLPVVVKITLASSDNKKLEDSSIKGILKDLKSKDFKSKELYINIENTPGENDFKLTVTSGSEGKLEYQLKCFNEEDELDIKYELDKWIDKNKPIKILEYWLGLVPLIWIFGLLTILIWFSNLYDTTSPYSKQLDQRAIHLIEKGIDQSNIYEAINLLLQGQVGYKPKGFEVIETLDVDSFHKLLGAIALFIILVLCPKSVIGIGKSAWKVKFNKLFLKFSFGFIPFSIFLPKLIEWVNKFF